MELDTIVVHLRLALVSFQQQRSFSMDTNLLKQRYKQLMSKLHPDLHRTKSEEEQDDMHDQASVVTQAYRTLKDPQHRALHLLELMGKPLQESATVRWRKKRVTYSTCRHGHFCVCASLLSL